MKSEKNEYFIFVSIWHLHNIPTAFVSVLYLRDLKIGLWENLIWRALEDCAPRFSLVRKLWRFHPYSFICHCHSVFQLPPEVLDWCYPGGFYGKLRWFKGYFLRLVTTPPLVLVQIITIIIVQTWEIITNFVFNLGMCSTWVFLCLKKIHLKIFEVRFMLFGCTPWSITKNKTMQGDSSSFVLGSSLPIHVASSGGVMNHHFPAFNIPSGLRFYSPL